MAEAEHEILQLTAPRRSVSEMFVVQGAILRMCFSCCSRLLADGRHGDRSSIGFKDDAGQLLPLLPLKSLRCLLRHSIENSIPIHVDPDPFPWSYKRSSTAKTEMRDGSRILLEAAASMIARLDCLGLKTLWCWEKLRHADGSKPPS